MRNFGIAKSPTERELDRKALAFALLLGVPLMSIVCVLLVFGLS